MKHQLVAIAGIEKQIRAETPGYAAYYGSYILGERETGEIKTLFPDIGPSCEISTARKISP